MNSSRRSLLKVLGLAPVAAPLAAKAALDGQIAVLSGVATQGVAPSTHIPSDLGTGLLSGDSYTAAKLAAGEYAKAAGVPDFVKEQMRRYAFYVTALDPDLAAKRSWSMAVKILTQRERNYERQLEAFHHGVAFSRAGLVFKKITGWDWPW